MNSILCNRPFPVLFQEAFNRIAEENVPLFCIAGDLNLDNNYGESLLCFCEDKVFALNSEKIDLSDCYYYHDLSEAFVKRLYGNALFSVKDRNGNKRKLCRFTYACANVADAGADFINAVIEHGFSPDLMFPVENTFNNQRAFCPKCGRKLPSPGAECLNCEGKGKMIGKFAKYALPYRTSLIVCMLLSIFSTALSLIPPYITGYMVDTVLPQKDNPGLVRVVLLLLFFFAAQNILAGARSYLMKRTGAKIVIALKKDIYKKAQYLSLNFYDKISTGHVITIINSDTATLENFVMILSQEVVVQFFTLVGIFIIMMLMNWKLTLIALCPIPVVVIVGKLLGKKIGPRYMRLWRRSTSISGLLTDTIPGIRIIKAFTSEQKAVDKFDRYCNNWLEEEKGIARTTSIFPAAISFFALCGGLLTRYIGGTYVINGIAGFSAGMLVSFLTYTSQFYTPVNFFANFTDPYRNTLTSAENILEILDAEPEHNFGKGFLPDHIEGKIEFKNVNFSFDHSKKVLSNIDLTIEPGDVVGIVGTTGAGKSTIINLIMRYYDSYDGEILVDGIDIRNIDMEYYRGQIGYVQQEPLMFKDTIFNNIAYGTSNAPVEQVLRAADIANAHTFISRLPDGYDTLVGERGTGLSGGEKQRISIARAIMKNPAILILDEATAAVDSETEKLIQEAIDRLIKGRTTLMIAHRLSTLKKANKIIVVDKGRIIEFGTPDELLALKGKYYKLVQIQSMGEQLMQQKKEENFD